MKVDTLILLIQTIFVAVAAGLTWYLYNKAKKDDLRSRATMLYYQVKTIQENINYIRCNCFKSNAIWTSEFYKSTLIFSNNLWEQNKFYISKHLSVDNYNEIERFYTIASNLLSEQIVVKNDFANLIAIKQKFYYETQLNMNVAAIKAGKDEDLDNEQVSLVVKNNKDTLDKGLELAVENFTPYISSDIVRKNLEEYKELTDGLAFERIKQIAKIQN